LELSILFILLLNLLQHIFSHLIQIKLGIPSQVLSRSRVIHRVGPAVSDSVRRSIRGREVHFEIRNELLDRFVDHFRVEAHRADVVDALGEVLAGGFEHFDGGVEAVRHVHQGEVDFLTDGADVLLLLEGVVVGPDGVVSRAATRLGAVRDDAGIAEAAEVNSELSIVVGAEFLGEDLGDAVDGLGVLVNFVRGDVGTGFGREGSDRGGDVEAAVVGAGDFEHVLNGVDTEFHAEVRTLFTLDGHDGGVVNDGADVFGEDDLFDGSSVDDVEEAEGTRGGLAVGGFGDVGGDDLVGAVGSAELADEFRTDLTVGTSDEDAAFREEGRFGESR